MRAITAPEGKKESYRRMSAFQGEGGDGDGNALALEGLLTTQEQGWGKLCTAQIASREIFDWL